MTAIGPKPTFSVQRQVKTKLDFLNQILANAGRYLTVQQNDKQMCKDLLVDQIYRLDSLAHELHLIPQEQVVVGLVLPDGEQVLIKTINRLKHYDENNKTEHFDRAVSKDPVVIDSRWLWTLSPELIQQAAIMVEKFPWHTDLNTDDFERIVKEYMGVVDVWKQKYTELPKLRGEGYVFPAKIYEAKLPGFYR